jgi:metallo-beta-lactamase family protein
MKLISHGAAREVTGSCHELQIGDKRILLDCGLFQGSRKKAVEKNATFAFDPAQDIDAVVLSHAHMDHVGRIPVLWKKGYRGSVFCTYATKDLAHVMLQDSGYIHEKDEEYFCKHLPKSMIPCEGPLYTQQDAIDCGEIFKGINYEEWFDVLPGIVRAKFLDAGHVLGAAMVVLEITENGKKRMIGFSGDLGRDMLPIIRDPADMPPVEALICESTYGNREHEGIETAMHQLQETIVRTAERGGKLLIPAFSLERTQEIIYDLHILWDQKKIPEIPIVIDSPLASRVTEIFMKHPECYDKKMYEEFLAKQHNPFQFSLVRFTESVQESKDLNDVKGPMILMAGAGMCEGGRIRHHLKHNIEDERCTILAVGYMAENTLGRRIIEKSIKSVKIFDHTYQKRAETVYINAYSGHADMHDLDSYIDAVSGLKKIFLVHGEEEGMGILAKRTKEKHPDLAIEMPERGSVYEL